MHPDPRRILPIVLILAALAAMGYWYFVVLPAQAAAGALTASGTIVITQIQIGAELGGRVVAVNANDGDLVRAGDTLIQLDTALLEAQRMQAQAALSVAQANAAAAAASVEQTKSGQPAALAALAAAQAARDTAEANQALLQAGPTDEQVLAAQAQADQAEAGRRAIEASLYALTAAARPEAVNAAWQRLTQAREAYYRLQVPLNAQQIEAARTALNTAQVNHTQTEARKAELVKDSRSSPSALNAASVAISDAQAALEAVSLAHDAVQDGQRPFYAQIEAARSSWELAQLLLSQADARHKALDADPNMTQEALDAAQSTLEDAQTLVEDTQSAYDALAGSDQADRLETAWRQAQDALTDLNALGRGGAATVESLLNQLKAAAAQQEAAAANLAHLKNGARPEQLAAAQGQVDAAASQVDAAQAQVAAAQSRLDAAQAQLDAAAAQVTAAQAALYSLDVQMSKLTILAPADGVVLTRIIQPGEIALPSATLLVLGLESEKTITVYVPEDRYGEITVGQQAAVSVDSFPGVSFKAQVLYISDQAEFTPRNVQTVEGRKNTVFAIRLQIIDADERLKAGMPADVSFK